MDDEARLAEIEREIAVGRTLPGRADAYALTTMTALVGEVRHLRAALHRMRDLGQGMSRTWYLREIDDGLNDPALTHER